MLGAFPIIVMSPADWGRTRGIEAYNFKINDAHFEICCLKGIGVLKTNRYTALFRSLKTLKLWRRQESCSVPVQFQIFFTSYTVLVLKVKLKKVRNWCLQGCKSLGWEKKEPHKFWVINFFAGQHENGGYMRAHTISSLPETRKSIYVKSMLSFPLAYMYCLIYKDEIFLSMQEYIDIVEWSLSRLGSTHHATATSYTLKYLRD